MPQSRRSFIKNSLAAGTGAVWAPIPLSQPSGLPVTIPITSAAVADNNLNLAPAQWIWFPSERSLANTVVLFRRVFTLDEKPVQAKGWILGDSRYKLHVNGQRIQFGPAPADPRWPEADPIDLGAFLSEGKNVIGTEVLFYGNGDGTWPMGKPGFIFYLEILFASGTKRLIVSDPEWESSVAKSWRPGQYKRWYLRALQEEFDARRYPYGWNSPDFVTERPWERAMILSCPPDKPSLCSNYRDYLYDMQGDPGDSALRKRSISLAKEGMVVADQVAESMWLNWRKSPEEYFAFITPNAFDIVRSPSVQPVGDGWQVTLSNETQAAVITFELSEQIVGFPFFTIHAEEGTTVELLVHEAHRVGGDALINTHFHAWTRFICKEGANHFETFDYECLRWLQLHIRGKAQKILVSNVGVRRRAFDWINAPVLKCDDPTIQKVIDAALNTLYNCAVETIVDGMGRERQQYSGDVGHVIHAVMLCMGEPSLVARFIKTYSQGMTSQGYFLDCWPAYDRLARIVERELGVTRWGPLLDHGVGFNFDCYHYYLYTGEMEAIKEAFPRLVRFFNYLLSIKREGLLPVEDIGVPVVWIDHNAYKRQRHKQCAFNLYAAAMMVHALSPLCVAFGEHKTAKRVTEEGEALLEATKSLFWSESRGMFVNNLPWIGEENEVRLCDRSLATSILFDQCPDQQVKPSIEALRTIPEEMGLSYPANANWRYWALSKAGDDTFIREMREKWSKMDSVILNNTIAEDWHALPDTSAQWSHCALSPMFAMNMCVAGIKVVKPGFEEIEIAPVLGDLAEVTVRTYTPKGPIEISLNRKRQKVMANLTIPKGIKGFFKWRDQIFSLKEGEQNIVCQA